MMPSKEKIKKILIILALLFVNAWFWGNAALVYYYQNIMASDDYMRAQLNRVPERLELTASDIEGEYLYFYGYKMKIPELKNEKNVRVSSAIEERRLWAISLFIKEDDKIANYMSIEHLMSMDTLSWELIEKSKTATLSEFSWWNLLGNIELTKYLTLKFISIPSVRDYERFEVVTPEVKGFLTKVHIGNGKTFSYFQFMYEGNNYNITLSSKDKDKYNLRDIISTIRKVDDIDKGYAEMERLYKNNTGYPEDLLVLSLLSLKEPADDYLKEQIVRMLKERIQLYEVWLKDENEEAKREPLKKWIKDAQSDIEYFEKGIE